MLRFAGVAQRRSVDATRAYFGSSSDPRRRDVKSRLHCASSAKRGEQRVVGDTSAADICRQLKDPARNGVVLAWEAARVLAGATPGLVKDHDDGQWRVAEDGALIRVAD